MQPLSVFPEILFLAPFAAFLIRIALAILLGYCAWKHLTNADKTVRTLGFIEGVVATALALGTWTQPAAIAGMFIIGAWFALPRLRAVALGTAFLAFVMCLSLLLTGAGLLAFDLPL